MPYLPSVRFVSRPSPTLRAFAVCGLLTAAVAAQNIVDVVLTAAPAVVSLGTNASGVGAVGNAWTYGGVFPGQAIVANAGDTLRVRFLNNLPAETIVHFHGLPAPVGMDGMPMMSRPPVAPGQEFTYVIPNLPAGTYWYHSHVGTQIENGLKGPIIVNAAPGADPYADVDYVVFLDYWSNPLPGATPSFVGHTVNGKQSAGQTPFAVTTGQTARFRFINGSSVRNYVVAIDQHPMTVTHADGQRVQPVVAQAIPIGTGERYDVLVPCNNPGQWSVAVAQITNRNTTVARGILSYAGSAAPIPATNFLPPFLASGTLLTYAQLASFSPTAPIDPNPERSYPLNLSQSGSTFNWEINGEAFPNVTPQLVSFGDDVEFAIANYSTTHHPMHTHGHFFRLMGTAGGTTNAPLKDTMLINPVGQPGWTASIQLVADNPGSWMVHCHHLGHSETGMIAVMDYDGDYDGDAVPDAFDLDAQSAFPVVTIPMTSTSFDLGAFPAFDLNWSSGSVVALFVGAPATAPTNLGTAGLLELDVTWPVLEVGSAVVGSNYTGTIVGAIPNLPAISGAKLLLQGVGTSTLAPGYRLSTSQILTIN
jgi:FtsP/CotA-like multicopper oxidase with cupredoxin domain